MSNEVKPASWYREQLEILHSLYSERRSDVQDAVDAILDGQGLEGFEPEHRYAKFVVEGMGMVEYDTYTTLLWVADKEEYVDGIYTND